MPLSVCKNIDINELKSKNITLQLVERPFKYLIVILKDVPIRICMLFIPIYFVVMEMEEESQVPIILGRHFLTTPGIIIDVKYGRLNFNIGDENIGSMFD